MAKIDKKSATARSGAVEILQQVLGEGAYTNIAVNKFLRSHEERYGPSFNDGTCLRYS